MEESILSTLHFNTVVPNPYVFMKRFLKVAQFDEEMKRLVFFLHGALSGDVIQCRECDYAHPDGITDGT